MRAPKLLRPRSIDETFVRATEEHSRHYGSVNDDINLPVREVVAALQAVMLAVQQRVGPFVTFEVTQHRYGYFITLRWQSPTGQIQLEGTASQLGLSLRLTSAFGRSYELKDNDQLAWWNCSVGSWDERGKLNLYRLGKIGVRGTTYLRTSLSVFEKIERRTHYDYPSWQREPVRPDLIDDIVEVTQVAVSAL
jgi:hypothetical protein